MALGLQKRESTEAVPQPGLFRTIVESVTDGIVVIDERSTILYCNPAAERLFGWPDGELAGRPIDVLVPEEYRARHQFRVRAFAHGEAQSRRMGSRQAHILGQRYDGSEISLGITILRSGSMMMAVIRDLSDWIRENRELERLANTDPLSGLQNRRGFSEAAERAIRKGPGEDCRFFLLMLDIDFFKQVNDRHGHDAGDAAIRNVAVVMREALRSKDLVARWGGEEFVALLSLNGRKEALMVAERLRMRIASTTFSGGPGVALGMTASIGLVDGPGEGEGLDAFVRRADLALYEAKAKGRNRVVFLSP